MTEATGLEPYTPVKIRDTSATERAAFRRCRRQWFLTVVHRLQSVEGNQNFWLGTLVHSALEAYYRSMQAAGFRAGMPSKTLAVVHEAAVGVALDTYEEEYTQSLEPLQEALGLVWPNAEPSYAELGELGYEMVAAYLERELKDPIFDEIVEVERRVSVAILNPNGRRVGWLAVMADLVGRRDGLLGVADHKTASREMSALQLDLDDQLSAEVYAVWKSRKDGEFPEEAVYNVLMKKVPKPPRRNKDKKGVAQLSRDKDQSTTYDLYHAEVVRLGLPVSDYAEILEHFRDQDTSGESRFFRRERVIRSPDQMASFEANLFEEWKDIRAVAAHPERAYPNPTPFSCPSCPVKLVCMTMMDGGDVGAIIKASYTVGDPRR